MIRRYIRKVFEELLKEKKKDVAGVGRQVTGKKYEEVFHDEEMKNERRIISHAINNQSIDKVLDKNGKTYSISEAIEKNIDWIQIDVGFLTEEEKEQVLESCRYTVINGSHTVMGEIMGINAKPVIGMPVYDEHENNLKWAQEQNLGIMAKNKKQVILGVNNIKNNYNRFEEKLENFSNNFVANGAEYTAKIASETLENKK